MDFADIIAVVKDKFGLISLAMLLLAWAAWALLRDASVIQRIFVFGVLVVFYGGVVVAQLLPPPDSRDHLAAEHAKAAATPLPPPETRTQDSNGELLRALKEFNDGLEEVRRN